MHNAPLLNAISAAAISRITEFDNQEFANIAWAYANFECRAAPLFHAISAEALRKIRASVCMWEKTKLVDEVHNFSGSGDDLWRADSFGNDVMSLLQACACVG